MVSGAAPLSAGVVDLARKKFSTVGATLDITQGSTFVWFLHAD
jgi:hypothetical protein